MLHFAARVSASFWYKYDVAEIGVLMCRCVRRGLMWFFYEEGLSGAVLHLRFLPEKIEQGLGQVVGVRCHDLPALLANKGDTCLQIPEK